MRVTCIYYIMTESALSVIIFVKIFIMNFFFRGTLTEFIDARTRWLLANYIFKVQILVPFKK